MSYILGSKIASTIIEEIKDYFKDYQFDRILLGFYSNGMNDKMTIFAELF